MGTSKLHVDEQHIERAEDGKFALYVCSLSDLLAPSPRSMLLTSFSLAHLLG